MPTGVYDHNKIRINDGLTHNQRHRLRNPDYVKNWSKNHPERTNNNSTRTSRQWKAHNKSEKIPLEPFCEVCPEDDKRKAIHRHHPDYSFPKIFVSCCASCHKYAEKGCD